MFGRRGRPPGARPLSEKDLKTPTIGQFFHQQPFAAIFQRRMGGCASEGAGSQQGSLGSLRKDPVDLTGGSGDLGVLMTRIRMIGTMRSARLLEI